VEAALLPWQALTDGPLQSGCSTRAVTVQARLLKHAMITIVDFMLELPMTRVMGGFGSEWRFKMAKASMTCPCGATLTADSVEALAKEIKAHTKRVHNTDTSDSEALEMAKQAAAGK